MENHIEKLPEENVSQALDQSLLSYIDHEIDYIRNEIQQPGWTLWATLGGLASLVYLLIDNFSQKQLNLITVFLLYTLADMLIALIRVSLPANEDPDHKGRFKLFESPTGYRLLFNVALSLISIVLAYKWQSSIEKQIVYSIIAWYGSLILMAVVVQFFKAMTSGVQLPAGPKKGISISTGCIFGPLLFLTVYLAWRIINNFITHTQIFGIEELKVALILVAIVFLLGILIRIRTKSPILSSLAEIRRNYFLGAISTKEARERVEIALLGLKVSDILQKQLSEFLSTMQATHSALQTALAKLNVLQKVNAKGGDLSDEDTAIKESVSDGIEKDIENAVKNLIRIDFIVAYTVLKTRIGMFGKYPDSKEDVSVINAKCNEIFDQNLEMFYDLLDKWENEVKNYESKEYYLDWTTRIAQIMKLVQSAEKMAQKWEATEQSQ
ncbi:MAG TPA: hypothetical protein VHP14_15370 [Anaerolineales bacterium]|nr:hypothetical protein [Anaerolineales bacterium]